jgi:signal transduction histidine kinase
LAVILGAAERLMVEPRLSDAGRRHLLHIRQSVVQLEQTVATLLALAREEHIDTGDEPVLVLPVLERVIVEQAPLLDGKPVEVAVEVPREARVALPAPVLRILLSNLVGNGFSHTQSGEVRIDVRQGRLRIANSADASEPVSRWREPRAFSKRAGSSGFGLGLSIVRRLGERYRIGLQVEEADGFVVASIPLAGAETPASGAGDHRQSARPS